MKRIFISCLISLVLISTLTVAIGQAESDETGQPTVPQYRVMSLVEMFKGDDEARKKLAQMIQVKKSDDPQRFHRTDMDAKDYERALNRLAADGWTLVAVNRSNYWVFKKE